MLVAEIIVLANAPNRYTYIIPETLVISVGDFVHIVFAKTEREGLVTRCYESNSEDHNFTLSSVNAINTKRARVPIYLIQLIDWFAPYYCVTDYVALQCIVGNKKHRDTSALSPSSPAPLPCLSPTQQGVFKAIQTSKKPCHALHGITGSGKTQIYAHLIQACIQRQQSALILIPEISLTPQFTAFFSRHFSRIGVVHSGLTPKNKDIIWNQCLNGELDLVMGPRSAIFMPFESLGLIIIDEEHDNSYKQDSTPRYYTHTVAVERARIQNSTVVFGSATLGVDTHYATQTSDMVYHALTERFNTYPLPDVSILNMTNNQGNWLIHDTLLKGIEKNLNAQKRTLILVNRRGYSSFLKCRSCGAIQECPGCQSSFTYHSDGVFRCHKCMTSQKMTRKCSDCGAFDV
ncbi:MAG: replication restart helicase PriA, partial [Candidatus Marinamargulisbacteria bacterium]